MAAEYLLALATTQSPRQVLTALGCVEIECEATPRGERCSSATEDLTVAAWVASDATRAAVARDHQIWAEVWMLLRIGPEQPERGHRAMIEIVAGALGLGEGDLILYRDEDVLLSRRAGRQVLSRRLAWNDAELAAVATPGCELAD